LHWQGKKDDKLVEKDPVTQASQTRATQMIEQAKNECEQTKRDADEYVIQTLRALESELEKSITQVKNGIMALQVDKTKTEEVQ